MWETKSVIFPRGIFSEGIMRGDDIGLTRVWLKEDPDPCHIHPELYDKLKSAWMKGEAFFEGYDCYGDEMVIKLGGVVAISKGTPENMAKARADFHANKKKEMFEE
jgi:hypothetical protein